MEIKQTEQRTGKRILLAIDVQKGFERKECTLKNAEKIGELLRKELFDAVIATQFFNTKDSVYYRWLHWPRLQKAEDTALNPEVLKKSCRVITKNIYNCPDGELMSALRECNEGTPPDSVYLCGMDTDCCVQLIAARLFELGIHPIVLTSYCASNGGETAHLAGLTVMGRVLGKIHLTEVEPENTEQLDKIRDEIIKREN